MNATTSAKKSPIVRTLNVQVGDGMTMSLPQDMYPYVVTRVSASGKTVWVKPVRSVDKSTGHEPARFDGPFPIWSHVYTAEELQELVYADVEERAVRLVKASGVGHYWTSKGATFHSGGAQYYRNYSY